MNDYESYMKHVRENQKELEDSNDSKDSKDSQEDNYNSSLRYKKYKKYKTSKKRKYDPLEYSKSLPPNERIDYHEWELVDVYMEMINYCRNECIELLDNCKSSDLFNLIEKNS